MPTTYSSTVSTSVIRQYTFQSAIAVSCILEVSLSGFGPVTSAR